MRSGHIETSRRFWWLWAAGCVGGWFLGFLIGFIFAGSFDGVVASGPVQSAGGYMALGLFVGSGSGLRPAQLVWALLVA